MSLVDVYGRTQELDRASLDAIATRLEARRGSEPYMRMLHEYLDALDWRGVADVLALGCGTGVEVRELLRRPGFAGQVTAVDISPVLIDKARKFAIGEGIAEPVDWRVGDAQALDLPDASFDLVLAHTLVSHVPDPERVIREIARVVRPGRTAVVFDGDYATTTYGTDDPETGRRMDEKIIASTIVQPCVMRTMPRMLRRAGLELVDSRGWVLAEIGRADFFLASLESFRVLLPKAGVATAEEVDAFVADQLRSSDEVTFFAGANFYAMIARRPGTPLPLAGRG
jgi:ubiquinone/menaquinone biosynthesis C-methylase UbiE